MHCPHVEYCTSSIGELSCATKEPSVMRGLWADFGLLPITMVGVSVSKVVTNTSARRWSQTVYD